MKLTEHPTVIAHAARATDPPPSMLQAAVPVARVLEAGADGAAFVHIDNPALDDQRDLIRCAFPRTRALLSFVVRMNRENVRTPARSFANGEFHGRRDDVDDVACTIVGKLERLGVPALSPPMAFPMEADRWPNRMWIVSHKPVAIAAGLGKMGIHRNVIHPVYAEAHVAKRFANKRTKVVSGGLRVPPIASFLFGITLSFQREHARNVRATYHMRFTGDDARDATIRIADGSLAVEDGHIGVADLRIDADARSWLAFVNNATPLWRLLLTRKIRPKGPLGLFIAFGKCFST